MLVDEDGHEHTLQVLERVELNGNDYAILVPWDEEEDDSAIPFKIVVEEAKSCSTTSKTRRMGSHRRILE